MAKYQAYAEYKDSGVEWLGQVPTHWDIKRIKETAQIINGYPFDSGKFDPVNGTPLVRIRDINSNETQIFFNGFVPKEALIFNSDILIGMDGDFNVCEWKGGDAALNQRVCCLRSNDKYLTKFLAYLLPARMKIINDLTYFTTVKHLSSTDVLKTVYAIPNKIEYVNIVKFLDHETAKIDHLIEKQQQLIELLKEKRQAVISHAVTKGLDPNVPMKDSGVEWLGEVPEHWQLVPLKYLCTFSGGGTPTKDNLSYWTDGNIPWVSPKDMKTFWISETQDYITEKAVKESSTNTVEQNSLLMVVRSGILQRTIPIAINTVPVTMNQDMKALKFGKRVLVEYIANLIHGNTVQLLLEWSKEGATVESIEHEYLANSLIPVPSLKEQEEITQVIAKKMKVYAELTEKAELQITLLQERRTALISAAVTGKIDVRNWQAPMVAEAQTELSA
ncbi:restriction endonuclease subunit S [Acinetobacter baumannii]|nr:restriction endonuclease subunit S [Acinetobacter baumannii]